MMMMSYIFLLLPVLFWSNVRVFGNNCKTANPHAVQSLLSLDGYRRISDCTRDLLTDDKIYFRKMLPMKDLEICLTTTSFGISVLNHHSREIEICSANLEKKNGKKIGYYHDCRWTYVRGQNAFNMVITLKARSLKNESQFFLWLGSSSYLKGNTVSMQDLVFDSKWYHCPRGKIESAEEDYGDDIRFSRNVASYSNTFNFCLALCTVYSIQSLSLDPLNRLQ
ncbi:hypothetical protein Btru_028665 [Bulinus truncatus]|nr:hypothetical protein Btru_028665 [Bulinus truncatus]